jgi:putative acetyltransferase
VASAPVEIRRAIKEDAKAVCETCLRAIRSSGPASYSPAQVEAWALRITVDGFARKIADLHFLIASYGEVVAGFGALDLRRHELDYLYVDPDWQGKGVGRLLCEALESEAISRRFRALHLIGSLNALEFYKRMGYVVERTIRRELEGVMVPCVVMSKRLQVEPSRL